MDKSSEHAFWTDIIPLSRHSSQSLETQIRKGVVGAILDRRITASFTLPSSRGLADMLGVSRGTVVNAYRQLAEQGFLTARERSGYRVNPIGLPKSTATGHGSRIGGRTVDWARRSRDAASAVVTRGKSKAWTSMPFPFVYGQFDPNLFPTAEWRECSRMALATLEIRSWAVDMIDKDDPLLISQIQARILSKRGVPASPDEIIVTLGAQHAVYMVAATLVRAGTRVAIEEPCYPEARSVFKLFGAELIPIPVDKDGLDVDSIPKNVDYVFATPGHHCPSMVPLSAEKRRRFLQLSEEHGWVVIEDDYNSQIPNFGPQEALKQLDRSGRVIYIGSMSKTLAPGLRLGFLVAPKRLIREIRALRQMMIRHPPANNQRAVALFMELGHHESLIRRLSNALEEKRQRLFGSITDHMSDWEHADIPGATAIWLKGPKGTDARALAAEAARRGIYVESGVRFFLQRQAACPFIRLGVSAIALEAIHPGIRRLVEVVKTVNRTPLHRILPGT